MAQARESSTPLDSTVGGSPSSIPVSQESHNATATETNKIVVTIDLEGNLIGPNKSKLKTQCLALAKVIVGVVPSDWREVSDAKEKDIWEILQQEFNIPSYHKENILAQLVDQWNTWKKNIRKRCYFGSTSHEILALKDKVPVKEQITVAA